MGAGQATIKPRYKRDAVSLKPPWKDERIGTAQIFSMSAFPEKLLLRKAFDPSAYPETTDTQKFIGRLCSSFPLVCEFLFLDQLPGSQFELIFAHGPSLDPKPLPEDKLWELALRMINVLMFYESQGTHYPCLDRRYIVVSPNGLCVINPFVFPDYVRDMIKIYLNPMVPMSQKQAFSAQRIQGNLVELGRTILILQTSTVLSIASLANDPGYLAATLAQFSKNVSPNLHQFVELLLVKNPKPKNITELVKIFAAKCPIPALVNSVKNPIKPPTAKPPQPPQSSQPLQPPQPPQLSQPTQPAQLAQSTQSPQAPQPTQSPQAPQVPQAPQAPQAPQLTQTPQGPQALFDPSKQNFATAPTQTPTRPQGTPSPQQPNNRQNLSVSQPPMPTQSTGAQALQPLQPGQPLVMQISQPPSVKNVQPPSLKPIQTNSQPSTSNNPQVVNAPNSQNGAFRETPKNSINPSPSSLNTESARKTNTQKHPPTPLPEEYGSAPSTIRITEERSSLKGEDFEFFPRATRPKNITAYLENREREEAEDQTHLSLLDLSHVPKVITFESADPTNPLLPENFFNIPYVAEQPAKKEAPSSQSSQPSVHPKSLQTLPTMSNSNKPSSLPNFFESIIPSRETTSVNINYENFIRTSHLLNRPDSYSILLFPSDKPPVLISRKKKQPESRYFVKLRKPLLTPPQRNLPNYHGPLEEPNESEAPILTKAPPPPPIIITPPNVPISQQYNLPNSQNINFPSYQTHYNSLPYSTIQSQYPPSNTFQNAAPVQMVRYPTGQTLGTQVYRPPTVMGTNYYQLGSGR